LPTALALVAATLVCVFAAASRLPNDRRGKLRNIAE
jgi:hypothetical protein